MDGIRSPSTAPSHAGGAHDGADWVALLGSPGPGHQEALAQLHALLTKACRHQISLMSAHLPPIGVVRVEEIVNEAADEAMVAVLAKLPTFEGRSRFTTWAYKFGILYAAVGVRRNLWRHRDVELTSVPEPLARMTSPEQLAEGLELSAAVNAAIRDALTLHQRRVVIALLIDEVPIDVLAERLGTTRNALYKTLHDARARLRRHLSAAGYLPEPPTPAKVTP
ncbi:sigma-70 family RNA polymerase sigma factor [Sinomonas notoginsengisoli]|uniref:RNA polymerase sigma factor n=1 Tax=Sinomonas notoginsengisoli TaxID=1457311 RepID=UPI001F27B980|nr:sigma-70 family RNA polymerase sigma factor [Sinomonas notoginsengisoli]